MRAGGLSYFLTTFILDTLQKLMHRFFVKLSGDFQQRRFRIYFGTETFLADVCGQSGNRHRFGHGGAAFADFFGDFIMCIAETRTQSGEPVGFFPDV